MKRELPLLLLICVVFGIGLWFGIKWFMGGTEGAADSFDAAGTSGATGTVAQSESDPSQGLALGAEEISLREKARQQRFAELGLISEKSPEPTVALDVSLIMPDECNDAAIARVPTGLKFRYESSIIRGESIIDLQSLVSLYKDCDQGEFVLDESALGSADADDSLQQKRLNEVKYFFIQNSVPIDAVSFPEEQ